MYTKKDAKRARREIDQNEREAQCKANGHVWRNEYNTMRYCETCYALEKHDWQAQQSKENTKQ